MTLEVADECNQFQEQPHLIDSHLDGLLTKIINIIREEGLDYEVKHVAFRCLYFILKVRGFKVVARHLPHETADLEPLLHYLENQDPGVQLKWEIHYGLLLWLSIVVKIPFHLQRFDTSTSEPIMERILNVCKKYLAGTTKAQDMAFYVSAIYLTRPDVKDSYLPGFINWAHEVLTKDSAQFKKGVLSTLAGVFKHGQREQMMEHAHAVLRTILTIKFQPSELLIVKKPLVKVTQRIVIKTFHVFLNGRFDILETSICLLEIPAGQQIISCQSAAISVNDEDDDDYGVPEEIEEVLNEILQALQDKNREVQYSAAKGIGRLTSRISKNFADQPVMDCCCPSDCLLSCQFCGAMLYDELRGNFSVGSAVRDAACYLCWALARSYDPSLLQPFVHQLAKALVITTVFDRQLLTGCRFCLSGTRRSTGHFSSRHRHSDHLRLVRLRKNAYLQLSLFVAQYEEYRPHLIQHLVDRKVIHWDTVIRQLTSQAFHQMTFLDPESMKLILSTQILPRCTNPELYLRHGSILASGKVISALCQVAKDHQRRLPDELGDVAMESISQTCIAILEERFWRRFGGDQMRIAVCNFIQDLSSGGFPLLDAVVDRWLKALRECLASADSNVHTLNTG
ncbi:LOW QUALITY PROTEIN: hypothetical protein DAPPUDRAFT_269046 [Daphnia pulex]|uniref:Tubulin-folding cofactor D ARM repeats domain-containing protein n=1 Tax=Daphnia pulex TaxID=6669 RepID=E9HYR3_DAPPU|nr:LOW QUALITY PROTEIN: hypothetical protein DAPPUDRAFT_269046 [Daphnia pulex]|eukprot:EFX63116.1 LOW QUALITY PROTEIN: hypothetical protein DAPPUDRAFT_269046 [Daphnia pulex]